jgi:two-component system, response regulator / RNA-binding antiterminator
MRKRILLVTENPERAALLGAAVSAAGDVVAGKVHPGDDLCVIALRTQPDALAAWVESPGDAVRRRFALLARGSPLPVAMFADRATVKDIRFAVKAGISALAVDVFRPDRVAAVLEVAFARFSEVAALRARCEYAEVRFAERRRIERAKGIIMRRRNLPEDAAFGVLRQMARERRKRIPEVADSVIVAEEMLARSCSGPG